MFLPAPEGCPPASRALHARLAGSYTTPPCLEGALWAVFLSQKQELSAGQVRGAEHVVVQQSAQEHSAGLRC